MVNPRRSERATLFIGIVALVLLSISAVAYGQQAYPTRPVNVVAVANAGGTGDLSIRLMFGKAEKALGQPFVITNNNLAGGSVPLSTFAKAKPDGYNLCACATGHLVWIPYTMPVSYKVDEFVPVVAHALNTSGVVVKADSPFKTFKDIIEYARKNPGKFTYAVSGAGLPMDLAMQYVAKVENVQFTTIPVPTSDPNLLVLGGHVNALSASPNWTQHVKAGTMRLLAVHSTKRFPDFPDAPTFRELGYDFVHESLSIVLAPKGTPAAMVKKLEDSFHKAIDEKEYLDFLKKATQQYLFMGHEELTKYLEQSYAQVGNVMKKIKN